MVLDKIGDTIHGQKCNVNEELVFGQPWVQFGTHQGWPMTSGTGRTKGKGGGRRNHKINMAVKQVLVYLGLGHGEAKERRYSERKEQLS
jgi:hypothetical protein